MLVWNWISRARIPWPACPHSLYVYTAISMAVASFFLLHKNCDKGSWTLNFCAERMNDVFQLHWHGNGLSFWLLLGQLEDGDRQFSAWLVPPKACSLKWMSCWSVTSCPVRIFQSAMFSSSFQNHEMLIIGPYFVACCVSYLPSVLRDRPYQGKSQGFNS